MEVIKRGGAGLLRKCGSLKGALKNAYPTVDWRSLTNTRGYWENLVHQRELMECIGKELGVEQVRKQLRYNTMHCMLTLVYSSQTGIPFPGDMYIEREEGGSLTGIPQWVQPC